jgi:hypothetical protein
MRRIAPETDSADTHRTAITVALRGAKRPKLPKRAASQNTSATNNGVWIAFPACCPTISQRVRNTSRDV